MIRSRRSAPGRRSPLRSLDAMDSEQPTLRPNSSLVMANPLMLSTWLQFYHARAPVSRIDALSSLASWSGLWLNGKDTPYLQEPALMHKAHVLTGVPFVAVSADAAHPTPTTFLLAATSVPGFALFPDIDHPKSMVSSTYGWFTSLFSLLLGHRRETHSFPGIAAFGLVTWV